MSSPAATILVDAPIAPDPPVTVERAPAEFAKKGWLGRNFWALADQALISGTNFATGILTARALARDEFGTFAIVYSVLLFGNMFQSTLVTQAHNVIGATRAGEKYRRYTSSTGVAQIALILLEVLLVLPVAIHASMNGWAAAGMLWALIPAIVFWQSQEFVRRVLYTESRYAAAFWNDVIAYGGQTLVLAGLFALYKLRGGPFNGAIALYVLAGAAAVGVIVGAWKLRGSLVPTADKADVRENWHFGKWLLGGELLGWCYSLQMQLWWAAALLGAAASADLRAAQILFGPTRVISFFLATVLPIRFARTLHEHGVAAMNAQLRKVLVLLIPGAGSYCLLLALFPRPVLRLFGDDYATGDAVRVLVLFALSAFLSYVQMVVVAALVASRQTRHIFIGSVAGCVIALVMSPICIKLLGAPGSILSIIATTSVVTAMLFVRYRKSLNSPTFSTLTKEPV